MAGSWEHMTTMKGKLLNNGNFTGMIENLGDAYEAAEECFGMIWYLAAALAGEDEGPGDREHLLRLIRSAREHHKDGLDIGGVQRG